MHRRTVRASRYAHQSRGSPIFGVAALRTSTSKAAGRAAGRTPRSLSSDFAALCAYKAESAESGGLGPPPYPAGVDVVPGGRVGRGEAGSELGAGADAQLRVAGAGGPRRCARDEEGLRDLLGRRAVGGELGDAPLRGRELAAGARAARADAGELRARLARPSRGEPSASNAGGRLPRACSRAAPHLRCRRARGRARAGVRARVEGGGRGAERGRGARSAASLSARSRPRSASQRRAREAPRVLLRLGQPRRRAVHGLRPRSARRAPTSASTRSGATGNAPGSSTPSRRVCSQTARRLLGGPARVVRQQRGDAERARRLEQLPARSRVGSAAASAGVAPATARRRRPRAPRRAARGSAGSSALTSSSRSPDSAHSSSRRSTASQAPVRSSELAQVQPQPGVRDGLAALVGERQRRGRTSPAPGRRRRARDAAGPATALGRVGDVGGGRRDAAREALADVVDRRPAQAARPPERAQRERARRRRRPLGGERLLGPRLGLGDAARRPRPRRAAPAPRAPCARSARSSPALGQRALEVRRMSS